ncbi:MAG TPA: hypothetical protein VK901_13315 [Nitrospiraceae bacterium]|nr:hypothetical protein [Nitrospiraceae bacterium]
MADKNGQDKISLAGVQFVPVGTWPTNESHTLTITTTVKLDATTDPTTGATINVNNAGLYKWALRTGGEIKAVAVSGSANDAVNDQVGFTGKGTFSSSIVNVAILSPAGSAKNSQPLSFTIKGPASIADVNWAGLTNTDMGQVDPTYPGFNCATTSTTCTPTITTTFKATLVGPDTLVVLNGTDAICALCSETFSAKQTKQLAFLTGVEKALKFLEPLIHNSALKAKIHSLIIQIDAVLVAAKAPPSDPSCPGSALVAFDMATEAAVDGLILASDGSKPAEPAPTHYYAVISSPGVTWGDAKLAAEELGEGWHLATITSEVEQAIINNLLPDPTSFTGPNAQQYWIGGEQQNCEGEPGCNWQWINEEGMFWDNGSTGMFANWGNDTNGPGVGVQPDNAGDGQNHLSLDHRYGWGWDDNDQFLDGYILGYVAEGPNPLPPPPVIP